MEMEMQVEVGKSYKGSDGSKIGPMLPLTTGTICDSFMEKEGDRRVWDNHGIGRSVATGLDLIAEWKDGPVVTETVTKTRIVDGVYGRVEVCGRSIHAPTPSLRIGLASDADGKAHFVVTLTADELDAAAAIMTQLAEGLRNA